VRDVHGDLTITGAPGSAGTRQWRLPPPRHLPPAPQHLVDRTDELASLADLTSPPDGGGGGDRAQPPSPVVVMICGPAGMGKTALALTWLNQVSGRFGDDGHLYARLGPTPTDGPAAWLGRWLRALGVPPEAVPSDQRELVALWRTVAADRDLAILIEDASGEAEVEMLLPSAGSALVVVTARRYLPELAALAATTLHLRALAEPDAIDLLGSRGGIGDRRVWSALARRCGGVPLALTAIAGHLARRGGDSAGLVAELDLHLRRHRITSHGTEDSGMHQDGNPQEEGITRAALDAAYTSLMPPAARAYRLIALHPRSEFSSAAAAAALDTKVDAAGAVLADLAQSGLLTRTGGEGSRWFMHPQAQVHGAEMAVRDETPQDRDAAADRILEYYRTTALAARAAAAPYLTRAVEDTRSLPFADRVAALRWLETEHLALVAAARWAHGTGRHAHAYQIIRGMWPLYLHLRPADWVDTDHLGLAAAHATGDQAATADMHDRLGAAYEHTGNYDAALRHLTEAEKIWTRQRNGHKIAGSLRRRASVAARQHRYPEAIILFRDAVNAHQRLEEPREAALALIGLGTALTHAGRLGEAELQLRRAIDLLDEASGTPREDPYNRARALTAFGVALTAGRQYPTAREHLHEALEEMRRLASPHGEATVLDALAALAHRDGDPDQARDYTSRAVAVRTGHREPQ
jgi:tetratricopeptide (TPR) repeat protein